MHHIWVAIGLQASKTLVVEDQQYRIWLLGSRQDGMTGWFSKVFEGRDGAVSGQAQCRKVIQSQKQRYLAGR
jgi:hypothetical protein